MIVCDVVQETLLDGRMRRHCIGRGPFSLSFEPPLLFPFQVKIATERHGLGLLWNFLCPFGGGELPLDLSHPPH